VPWRIEALYGQAFFPPDQGFAEVGMLGVGRDFDLGGRWGLGITALPLLRFDETVDLQAHRRHATSAFAAASGLSFTAGPRGARWRVVIEASVGPFYALDPVPASGTRWNFLVQGGPRLVLRLGSGLGVGLGYRFFHVSNAGLGRRNPGLSFHAFVLTLQGR